MINKPNKNSRSCRNKSQSVELTASKHPSGQFRSYVSASCAAIKSLLWMSHRPNIFQGTSVFHQPDRFVFSFTLLTNPWILWTPNIFCFILLRTVVHDVEPVCSSPRVICFLFVVQKTVKTVNQIFASRHLLYQNVHTHSFSPNVKMLLWLIYGYWHEPHTNKMPQYLFNLNLSEAGLLSNSWWVIRIVSLFVRFHADKTSSEPKSIDMVFTGGEKRAFFLVLRHSGWTCRILHFLITAAIIWAKYQTKVIV